MGVRVFYLYWREIRTERNGNIYKRCILCCLFSGVRICEKRAPANKLAMDFENAGCNARHDDDDIEPHRDIEEKSNLLMIRSCLDADMRIASSRTDKFWA